MPTRHAHLRYWVWTLSRLGEERLLARDPGREARPGEDRVDIGLELRVAIAVDRVADLADRRERAGDRDVGKGDPVLDQEAARRDHALQIVEQRRQLVALGFARHLLVAG